MSPDKQQALYDRYPAIFRDRTKPMTETCMHWGICFGDGWLPLLTQLCQQLDALQRATGLEVVFDQLKEKFSTARVYCHVEAFPVSATTNEEKAVWTDIVWALTSRMESQSGQTCEETGEYGRTYVSPTGWFRTLSAAKAAELGFMTPEAWAEATEARRVAREAKGKA